MIMGLAFWRVYHEKQAAAQAAMEDAQEPTSPLKALEGVVKALPSPESPATATPVTGPAKARPQPSVARVRREESAS